MAYTPHVNGPALIRVGNQGTSVGSGLNDIGFTDAGPQIAIEFNKDGVMADNAGPVIPADLQRFGKSAKINLAMVVYDAALLQTWLLKDGAEAEGANGITGQLIFANNLGIRVVITSPIDGVVWRFPWCSVDYCRLRPGSKYLTYDIGIDAIPYIANAASLSGVVLWDHTNT
jgi:hypothetical protein